MLKFTQVQIDEITAHNPQAFFRDPVCGLMKNTSGWGRGGYHSTSEMVIVVDEAGERVSSKSPAEALLNVRQERRESLLAQGVPFNLATHLIDNKEV